MITEHILSLVKPDTKITSIYLLRCVKYYKIGIARDVLKRLRILQVGNPLEIILVASWEIDNVDSAKAIEQSIHLRLKEYAVRGEWFMAEETLFKHTITEVMNTFKKHNLITSSGLDAELSKLKRIDVPLKNRYTTMIDKYRQENNIGKIRELIKTGFPLIEYEQRKITKKYANKVIKESYS
jgi:hypothetical protein